MTVIRSVEELNSSRGRVYYPRWMALITVPVAGNRQQRIGMDRSDSVVTLQALPKSLRIDRNDHNQADTCRIALDLTTAGIDSRMLDDATVEVHVADADASGFWLPSTATCRFVGITKEIDTSRSADEAAEVSLELVDYTDLFLKAKPFGSAGIPAFSQRIGEAWQTIVSQVPGAEIFLDPKRLVLEDVDPSLIIGKGVAERFRKIGKVQTKPETDAWAVWQQCVGMLGLVSYIDKDRCVVSTATNYYTEQDAPVLIWGKNIESWHESRISALARRGVCVTSFDPLALKTIEAYWPPIGDPSIKRKRAKAKKVLSTDKIRPNEERDYFSFPGVTEHDVLLDIARRVYEERSRQELEGAITTPHMWVETEQHNLFDLLDLRAGDTVRVEVSADIKQTLRTLGSSIDKHEFLVSRGYTEDAAELIIEQMKNFADLDARFLVKRVGIDMDVTENGGSFAVDIDYVNRIQIDGSAGT